MLKEIDVEIGAEQPLNTDTIILQSNIEPVVCSVIHNSKHKV